MMAKCSTIVLAISVAVGSHAFARSIGTDAESGRANRPNIVLVVADDLGWNDVGFHGSEIRTPRLDALARTSVVLNQFYVVPTCSPTRAALLTGRNPSRFGILGPLGLDPKTSLPLETVTLAELLADAGYVTGLVGKWHLGPTFDYGPRKQGFQFAHGYLHGQIDQFKHHYKTLDKSWFRDEEFVVEEGHATDLLARSAVGFIEQHREQPFFLYLCFSVPHYPLQEDERWVKPYEAIIEHKDRRLNAAAVTHMDDAIGRVLDTLNRTNQQSNTLVIFTSDNGGQKDWLATDYGGEHGPNERLGDNRPLRDWKGSVYEGGIRVPALAHWPGRLKPSVCNSVLCATDIFPTVARLIGKPLDPELKLDGTDIWPALAEELTRDDHPIYWNTGSQKAIRTGDWKLVESRRGGTTELFDLRTDPFEKYDRAADEQPRVQEMHELLERLMAEDPRR
jgi:arylsulfatase A-like enzyme